MTLSEYLSKPDVTAAALARDLNCHRSFVIRMATGKREFTRKHAITLYRKRGEKLGPIADATDAEIEVLARFESEAQP